MDNIKFLQAEHSEEHFLILRNIHRNAMYDSIVNTMGKWDDEFQKNRLQKHFEVAFNTLEFILKDDKIIGSINCRKKEFTDGEFNFIEQFYLLPEEQKKGIGKYVLNLKLTNNETRLTVLKNDTTNQGFYIANGFVEYQEDEYQKFFKKTPTPVKKNKPN